ncbi:hypothetical protein [Chelativorans xinjiangense]|uniref:hypothetical protein n=1 Tax=Chelativorans xinjiangense TaxID=2681485 RepID=UPI00135B70E6|nr:hypothetical protein [Chelativorans xinjiangense]
MAIPGSAERRHCAFNSEILPGLTAPGTDLRRASKPASNLLAACSKVSICLQLLSSMVITVAME